ncbi:hypothetical protein [Nocardia wallacei]|uniref:hypothetical protein n=1 Tax=Nocardia wallacei TaxID=480035 RepID=UPI0024547364|nr:hypothetical protein [Nocardia wallacei]
MTGPSHGKSFDRVVDALRQVTTEAANQSGEWTKFRCPVPSHGRGNGDRSPSLGVKYDPRREKTIVNCFSGCQQEDVLDVAQLRVRDLFDHLPDRNRTGARPTQPQRPSTRPNRVQRPTTHPRPADDLGAPTGPRRRIAAYTYTTAANEPVGQVIRYAVPYEHGTEKTFSQRRWDAGQRQWVPGGFGPVLYQAPLVAWAVCEGHPILVCEGEKDVDRAIAAGYPATCNAAGAGKFRPEHAEQLRGAAQVVIVADRDRPGFDHALQVHDRVRGLVGRVDVMQAATGKDLSDHLDAGHDLNDLTWIPPDQLDLYREGPADARAGHGTGPRRPSTVSTPGRAVPGQPEMDWGLDR